MCVWVRGKGTNRVRVCVCVCLERMREREIKELAFVIVEVGESKICRAGWQTGDPEKS